MELITFWGPLVKDQRICKYLDMNHNYYGCENFQREFEQSTIDKRNGCWNCRLKNMERK